MAYNYICIVQLQECRYICIAQLQVHPLLLCIILCLGHNKLLQSPSTDPIVGIMRWEEHFCTRKGCKHLLRLLHQFRVVVAGRRFEADVLDS
jgi:hypothetical protein